MREVQRVDFPAPAGPLLFTFSETTCMLYEIRSPQTSTAYRIFDKEEEAGGRKRGVDV